MHHGTLLVKNITTVQSSGGKDNVAASLPSPRTDTGPENGSAWMMRPLTLGESGVIRVHSKDLAPLSVSLQIPEVSDQEVPEEEQPQGLVEGCGQHQGEL